jgi:hypothetical protein
MCIEEGKELETKSIENTLNKIAAQNFQNTGKEMDNQEQEYIKMPEEQY